MIWTLVSSYIRVWSSFWNSSLFSLFPPFPPPFICFFLLFCHASLSAPLLLGEFSRRLLFSRRLSRVLNVPFLSLWPVPSIFCLSHFYLFLSDHPSLFSVQSAPPWAFSELFRLVLLHAKPFYSFLPSLKPRLSSLTIGDSERKSSATQQREPTADIHAESTGNHSIPSWLMFFLFLSTNIPKTAFTSFSPHLPGPGLVQRCVVVQKDQLGFGFTVCGERVKLVQNVRPGESRGHSWRLIFFQAKRC